MGIHIVIPLLDPELPVLAAAAAHFTARGVRIIISSARSVRIARDKLRTSRFLQRIGIPIPATSSYDPESDWSGWKYPVVLKPANGSAGNGMCLCETPEELHFYGARTQAGLVQEWMDGDEVTVDILSDGSGRLYGLGLRKRLKVRAGEVERAVTIRDRAIEDYARIICEHFKPVGAINVQCFTNSKGCRFTEINPRFAGGFPLSYKAGANFPRRILEMGRGVPFNGCLEVAQPGLVMMRFDAEFILRREELLS